VSARATADVVRAAEPAARTLARFCSEITWSTIPEPARERTAELLLDLLGVTVRGSAAESSAPVRELVRLQGEGPATVFGGLMRTSAAWAALANGTFAHAIEMDDVTTESSLHPGAAVIPAAIGVGQDQGSSSTDVLEAIVAGYEVTIRVGNALGAASAYRRGFHPTGVAGVFGAAVAAGKLMHLDADGLTRAIGIAGTMASGSLAYLDDGAWTKRLNPGWAAHGGIVAAGLARFGFTGPATALEGAHGLLRGYTDAPDPERLTEGLGTSELEIMHVSIKPYGCCRYSHGLIDAVLALRQEHGITADDVAKMRLGVLSGGWPLIAEDLERKRDPKNTVDAQFSAPFAAAVALLKGRAGLDEFEHFRDAQIHGLMARTECYRDPSLDAEYPKRWPAAVEITLRDGRVLKKRVEHALGEPENPVGREGLIERFVEMTGGIPDGRDVADRILHLEREDDLSVLQALV
jgi:2-methylcitrate dehydratase PrpD